jgi:uncharacterized protein
MFVNSCDAFIKELLLSALVVKKQKRRRKAQSFHQYFDWSEPLSKAPSHRLLAMLRAVNEGFVKLKIEVDVDAAYDTDDLISKNQNKTTSHIQLAIEDSFRLLNYFK